MGRTGWAVIALGWGVGLGAGCISSHQTVYDDAPAMPVSFETEGAARVFYEALSQRAARSPEESRTHVSIPVVLDVSKTRKRSYNVLFNEAVRRCDTNQDGRITELEARVFAAQPEG